MRRRLPAYGMSFQPIPASGVRVAFGPGAWDFAKNHQHPIMVLPDGEIPSSFTWPGDRKPALVYERGEANDERLRALAEALLIAGSTSVVALRESKIGGDPRVFFDREGSDVAA